ncbi:MAG TPA: riboflavin synthase [Candidatus Eisenbacteria bacterium]|nr:riboflavin synthase [Candidatus Eisenbacteria bacterium]
MFTGIIEATARVLRVEPKGGGTRVTLEAAVPLPRLALGESIAIDGACLTVTSFRGRRFTVEVSPETLRRTTLGRVRTGSRVNLERALRLGDRLGGHVVLGHVDGVGRIESITPDRDWMLYRFRAPKDLAPYLVEKGSVAVDGVSLTLFACRGTSFTVALIPHTLRNTTLGTRRPGDAVNLEADILLKQIAAMLRSRGSGGARRRARKVG